MAQTEGFVFGCNRLSGMSLAVLTFALLFGIVRSATAGTLERVSVASDGNEGNALSANAAVNTDGRFVAFGTHSTNFDGGPPGIFVHDRLTGATERVSVASDGTPANGLVRLQPAISADGMLVAFIAESTNLDPANTSRHPNVYVHDRQTGVTEAVTHNQTFFFVFDVAISADGRVVGYVVCCPSNRADHVVRIYDRVTATTEQFGESGGSQPHPVLSGDGRFVAYQESGRGIFVRDRSAGTTSAAIPGALPAISSDGRLVAFTSGEALVANDGNGLADIFVYDLQTGFYELVSVAGDGTQANAHSDRGASMSPDGRFVVFPSAATSLASGDTNGQIDIFLRDRQRGITERLTDGNGEHGGPAVNADGSVVAFSSNSSDLVSNDTNGASDVFVVDLGDQDTDGDGVVNNLDDCPLVPGDPAYAGCPIKRFEIVFMTFIPSNYIDASILSRQLFFLPAPSLLPGTTCTTIEVGGAGERPVSHILIGAGDDRGYNAAAANDPRKPYKSMQKATVVAKKRDTQTEFFLEQKAIDAGFSRSYVKQQRNNGGALNNGVRGRIDPADDDTKLHDCFLKHEDQRASTGGICLASIDGICLPDKEKLSETRVRLKLSGKAKNALIPLSPSIDWDLNVDIETGTPSPRVFVHGSKDQFPAYEIYVNNQAVYRFAPTNLPSHQLPVLRFGAGDLLGLFQLNPIQPVGTVLSQ